MGLKLIFLVVSRVMSLLRLPRSRAGLLGAVPYGQPAAAMFFLFGCGGGT